MRRSLRSMRPIVAPREHRGQRVGRPAFALMRLVEHDDVVGRQEAAADGEIEKEERVVDDDEVGVLRLVALIEEETVAKVRAELARRIRRRRRRAVPTRRRAARSPARRDRRSALRSAHSQMRCIERRLSEQPIRAHAFELLPAEIVRASFEQRDAQRPAERCFHERNVLMHELLLQRDRAGREHDLLSAANRRHQIRQRFPDARSRFDDRVHAFQDAALDELRHLQLSGARFEAAQRFARTGRPLRRTLERPSRR